jgi:hypothetical protein
VIDGSADDPAQLGKRNAPKDEPTKTKIGSAVFHDCGVVYADKIADSSCPDNLDFLP